MSCVVLDPDFMHISADDWRSGSGRDGFLSRFSFFLSVLDRCPALALAWCHELESSIFQEHRPPWVFEKDWSRQIWPIYYQLQLRMRFFDIEDVSPATCEPDFISTLERLREIFLRMLHIVLYQENDVYLCLEVGRKSVTYNIGCLCHDRHANVLMSTDPLFLLRSIDVAADLWPRDADDSEDIDNAISILLDRDFGGRSILYKYGFERGFVRRLVAISDFDERIGILNSMAKRLTMTKADAGRDGGLLDESIHRGAIRRFRVTKVRRIHYREAGGRLIFMMYYGDSEHDDGI